MSIINDALKKTQQTRKVDSEKKQQAKIKSAAAPAVPAASEPPKTKPSPQAAQKDEPRQKRAQPVQKAEAVITWRMASFLTVTGLLVIMALANYDKLVTRVNAFLNPAMNVAAATTNTSAPVAVAASPGKIKVAFEGVFMTNNTKTALINKQSLHVGDTINGMTIVAINEDSVDLQNHDGLVEIKAGATYLL